MSLPHQQLSRKANRNSLLAPPTRFLAPAELQRTRLPPPENGAAWDRLCFEQWQSLEQQQQQQGAGAGQQGGEAGSPPGTPPPPPPGDPPPGSGTAAEGGGGGGETDRICGPVLRTVLAMDQVGGRGVKWVQARRKSGGTFGTVVST